MHKSILATRVFPIIIIIIASNHHRHHIAMSHGLKIYIDLLSVESVYLYAIHPFQ